MTVRQRSLGHKASGKKLCEPLVDLGIRLSNEKKMIMTLHSEYWLAGRVGNASLT